MNHKRVLSPYRIRVILVAARNQLGHYDAWTQGAQARDEDGLPVSPKDDDARSWDAMGAIRSVTARDEFPLAVRAFVDAAGIAEFVGSWNDSVSYGQVIAAFDIAIAAHTEAA